MQQPADIGRQLLRLRARQQHAVVQRMQKPALGDPVLFLDQDAVHHRDLPGRAAETQYGDPQPDPKGFAEADAVTEVAACAGLGRLVDRGIHYGFALLVGQLWVSPDGVAAPAIERVVQRHAGLELLEIVVEHPRQAERGGEQPGRFRRQIEPRRCRRRAPSSPAAASGGVARPNSSIMTSKVQSSPRWLQNTFSMSKGAALKRSPTRDNLGRRHEQEHRVRIDEAADQPRAGDAVDLRPRARHPDGAALRVARRQLRCVHQRKLCLLPAFKAAFKRLRGNIGMPQPGGRALRELCPAHADDDG